MISNLILSHPVKVSSTYGSTIPSLHVGIMNQAPFSAIPHVLVVVHYLHVLV